MFAARTRAITLPFMRAAGVGIFFIFCLSCAHALPLYRVVDLGDFAGGADQSQAYGINASGQIAGRGEISSGARAFVASTNSDGTPLLADLGSLPSFSHAIARSINARGQLVGSCTEGDKSRAFIWNPVSPNESNGSIFELLKLPGEKNAASPTGINRSGQVAGFTQPTAFLWNPNTPNSSSGTAFDLGALPGDTRSFAFGINDAGQIVGASASTAQQRAIIWTPTTPNGASGSMIDLGSLPGTTGSSQAIAINQSGDVVGTCTMIDGTHAFLWRANGAGMIDLGDFIGGTQFSYAFAINDARQIVGNANGADGDHAFLWTEVDGLVDLNSLVDESGANWVLRYAQGINENGEIAGWGEVDPDGAGPLPVATHAFRLDRIAEINPGQLYARANSPNEFMIYFVGRAGTTYSLETSASLQTGWQANGDPISGDGGLIAIKQIISGARMFYRVTEMP